MKRLNVKSGIRPFGTRLILYVLSLTMLTPFFLFDSSRAADEKNFDERTVTIDLQSNMVCGTTKRIIQKGLKKIHGIIDVDVDPETKNAAVTYDDAKIDVKRIEKEITKLGYDANDKEADPKAYQKLPDCCKTK